MKSTLGLVLGLVITVGVGIVAWERLDALEARRAAEAAAAEHLTRADGLADSGELRAAMLAVEAARTLTPQAPRVQLAQMTLQLRALAEAPERLAEADLPPLRLAIEVVGPDTALAQIARGLIAARAGRLDEARASFDAAVEAHPDSAPAHIARGMLQRRSGQLVEAQASFERARELAPEDVAALNNLGVVYTELDRAADAIGVFEAALKVRDNGASRVNLANALALAGRLPEAVTHLQRAVALEPGSAAIHRRLGGALQRQGDIAGAAAALIRAGELDPDPAIIYELALVYQGGKDFAGAAAALKRVLRADPQHIDAAYQLGATLQALGDGEGAARALEAYLHLSEGRADEATRRQQVLAALTPPAPVKPEAAAAKPRVEVPGPGGGTF